MTRLVLVSYFIQVTWLFHSFFFFRGLVLVTGRYAIMVRFGTVTTVYTSVQNTSKLGRPRPQFSSNNVMRR